MNSSDILRLIKNRHSGDVIIPECKNGPTHTAFHRRMDVWVMARSWSNFCVWGYEIKVSRNDFVNDKKWRNYLPYCNQFYFVCPWGLIKPDELPEDAGVLWVSKTGTRLYVKKNAPNRGVVIPEDFYRYILMARMKMIPEYKPETPKEYWQRWMNDKDINRFFGINIGKAIKKEISDQIISVREKNDHLERKIKQYEKVQKFLEENNINLDNMWTLENQLNNLKKAIPENFENLLNGSIQNLQGLCKKINELQEAK